MKNGSGSVGLQWLVSLKSATRDTIWAMNQKKSWLFRAIFGDDNLPSYLKRLRHKPMEIKGSLWNNHQFQMEHLRNRGFLIRGSYFFLQHLGGRKSWTIPVKESFSGTSQGRWDPFSHHITTPIYCWWFHPGPTNSPGEGEVGSWNPMIFSVFFLNTSQVFPGESLGFLNHQQLWIDIFHRCHTKMCQLYRTWGKAYQNANLWNRPLKNPQTTPERTCKVLFFLAERNSLKVLNL